jgi:hypothetical protein
MIERRQQQDTEQEKRKADSIKAKAIKRKFDPTALAQSTEPMTGHDVHVLTRDWETTQMNLQFLDCPACQWTLSNSKLITEYFDIRTKTFIDEVLTPIWGICDFWYRYEFTKSRGEIHFQMIGWSHKANTEFEEVREQIRQFLEDLGMTVTLDKNSTYWTEDQIREEEEAALRAAADKPNLTKLGLLGLLGLLVTSQQLVEFTVAMAISVIATVHL